MSSLIPRRRREELAARQAEAEEALRCAQESLRAEEAQVERVRERTPVTARIATGMRYYQRRNHFADNFRRALGGA